MRTWQITAMICCLVAATLATGCGQAPELAVRYARSGNLSGQYRAYEQYLNAVRADHTNRPAIRGLKDTAPGAARYCQQRGDQCRSQGDYDGAADWYRRALRIKPDILPCILALQSMPGTTKNYPAE